MITRVIRVALALLTAGRSIGAREQLTAKLRRLADRQVQTGALPDTPSAVLAVLTQADEDYRWAALAAELTEDSRAALGRLNMDIWPRLTGYKLLEIDT